jgi:allantoinase
MCEGPARLAGLQKRKGAIAVGCDADLVIVNPNAKFRVERERLHHRHKLTPYAKRELAGLVEATFVRGKKVFERGQFAASPAGRVLRRGQQ